jgi:hypothetical protein
LRCFYRDRGKNLGKEKKKKIDTVKKIKQAAIDKKIIWNCLSDKRIKSQAGKIKLILQTKSMSNK